MTSFVDSVADEHASGSTGNVGGGAVGGGGVGGGFVGGGVVGGGDVGGGFVGGGGDTEVGQVKSSVAQICTVAPRPSEATEEKCSVHPLTASVNESPLLKTSTNAPISLKHL